LLWIEDSDDDSESVSTGDDNDFEDCPAEKAGAVRDKKQHARLSVSSSRHEDIESPYRSCSLRDRRHGKITPGRFDCDKENPLAHSTDDILNRYICKSFEKCGMFVGKVVAVNGTSCTVVYDDDDREEMDCNDVLDMIGNCFIGQRVHKGEGFGKREGVVISYDPSSCIYQVQYYASRDPIAELREQQMVAKLMCRVRIPDSPARFTTGETVYAFDGMKYGMSTILDGKVN
jgi:hypothetical protein